MMFYLNQLNISKFGTYLDTCHPKIYFSFEQEKDGKLSFIDIEAFYNKENLWA